MTLVFVLIVVVVMLMMVQKLVVRAPSDTEMPGAEAPGAEVSSVEGTAVPGTGGSDGVDMARLRLLMRLLITLVGLVGGGYVALYGGFPPDVQKWAAGLMGSVVGFWMK